MGEDNADAYTAAELWRERIAQSSYQLDCGGPDMSCEDVADCIETNEAVQDAIAQQVINNPNISQSITAVSTVGAPMLPAQREGVVSATTDCDLDMLFGSITEILSQLDINNRDFLEIIEVGTNTRERITTLISAVPLIGLLPADEALQFLDKLQSEILENYEAQWTTSLKDEYRCDLFCLAQDQPNCELTFQAMIEYYNNRLGTALEPINFFGAVVQYFLLGTWAGSTVVDIMMLIQLSAWQEASNWLGLSLRTLQTVGLLGANNPDPDWNILCDECNDNDGCWDFLIDDQGVLPLYSAFPNTNYVPGEGRMRDEYRGRLDRVQFGKILPAGQLKKVTLLFNESLPNTTWVDVRAGVTVPTYKRQYANGTNTMTITGFPVSSNAGLNLDIGNDAPGPGMPNTPISASFRVIGVCWEYDD